MAKKTVKDIFARTETPEAPAATGRGRPYGVYLSGNMRPDLEQIAAKETGGNFHALIQYAVKFFIQEYKAGRVKPKKETRTRLTLE